MAEGERSSEHVVAEHAFWRCAQRVQQRLQRQVDGDEQFAVVARPLFGLAVAARIREQAMQQVVVGCGTGGECGEETGSAPTLQLAEPRRRGCDRGRLVVHVPAA